MAVSSYVRAWPQGPGLLLLLLAASALAALLIVQGSAVYRIRSKRRERAGISEIGFTAYLERFGFDPAIASTTYLYLSETQEIPFPILPDDSLYDDLGMDEEDVTTTLADLARILDRIALPGLRPQPLLTVEDLLRFLQACPRRIRPAAA